MQERDRRRIRIEPVKSEPEYIAGVDAAFDDDRVYAAACLYRYQDLTLTEQATATVKRTFPYIPGFLLFVEGPAIIEAVRRLTTRPDIILVDGQGIAHPRANGSASHLGVLLDIPTIGCAKTRLVGMFQKPGMRKGNWSRLDHDGRTIGAVVRTRDGVRPLFVSPGHRIDLAGAIGITMGCIGKYRIPQPLRCADMLSRWMRAGLGPSRQGSLVLFPD